MAEKDTKESGSKEAKPSSKEEKSAGKSENGEATGKKKLIIIASIIFGVILLQIGTALLFVHWVKKEDPAVEALRKIEEDEKAKIEMLTKIGTVLEKPIVATVNIDGPSGSHYLKTSIQLEWDGGQYVELGAAIAERTAKIQDIIINILSTQKMSDLLSSTGKKRIRDAIKTEINAIIPKEKGNISNVFFQEFIIQ